MLFSGNCLSPSPENLVLLLLWDFSFFLPEVSHSQEPGKTEIISVGIRVGQNLGGFLPRKNIPLETLRFVAWETTAHTGPSFNCWEISIERSEIRIKHRKF